MLSVLFNYSFKYEFTKLDLYACVLFNYSFKYEFTKLDLYACVLFNYSLLDLYALCVIQL